MSISSQNSKTSTNNKLYRPKMTLRWACSIAILTAPWKKDVDDFSFRIRRKFVKYTRKWFIFHSLEWWTVTVIWISVWFTWISVWFTWISVWFTLISVWFTWISVWFTWISIWFTLTYVRYGSDTTTLCLDILSLLATCVFQNNLQGTKIQQYMSPFMKVRNNQ